jgi:hypothetical protein
MLKQGYRLREPDGSCTQISNKYHDIFQNPRQAYLCLGDQDLVGYGRHKIHCESINCIDKKGIATKDTMWIYTLMTWTDRSHEEYTVDLRDDKT